MHIEDQTAPIKREDISQVIGLNQADSRPQEQLVARLVGYLNEKRDSYNGVISSIVFMIDANDEVLLDSLERKLHKYIATDPMRYGGKIFITRCLSRLIAERPEFVATFFSRFLSDEHHGWEEAISNHLEVLRIKIIALKAINEVEQKFGIKMTTLSNEVIDAICDQAILEGDDTIKIDTLHILLDTKQATKVLGDRELLIVRTVFREALNFQVPALRQRFSAITNKLMKRIRDSLRVVQRDKIRYTDSDRETVISRYMQFLEWVIKFCLDNIYCNKYFGSFIVTMTTLSQVIEHITLCNVNLPIGSLLESRRFYDSVLSCLALDSFEDNKKMALKLLFALPHSYSEQNLLLNDKIAYELVNSVNPAHSLTCQYIFKLVIGIRQKYSNVKKNTLICQHLDKLIRLVEEGVAETKLDFVTALKNNAIYPKLTCIRALLNEIVLEERESDRENWEKLTTRLVTACIESSQAVSSFVCNMNPETIGHLPMDLKPIDSSMLSVNPDKQQELPANHMNTITSQHLLITGWKTIKECSLSMGAMCSVFWWPQSKINVSVEPILKPDQIMTMIDYFEHYLRNLRHRGAFEQAYNGFVMVTKRIWPETHFRNILLDNLDRILKDFKSEEEELSEQKVDYLKKHVTRRSAGLPFLVQAIAVSEHKHESETLHTIMDTLVEVSNSDRTKAYQKIHCLNILKALMNDNNLGEKVIPYIGKVLLITIDAFSSDNFSIRNCANMLMRSLVDRTFGVSRLRDEVHKRNTMSHEKFFTDYPELHERFRLYLEEGLKDRRSFASVHAVFIVLSRLRPSLSPSDDFKIANIVQPYMKPLFQLARTCPDFKLRELSAKLYVQLDIYRLNEEYTSHTGKSSEFDNYMDLCISEISRKGWYGIDSNMFHGIACILKSWIELIAEIRCPIRHEQVFKHVNYFFQCGMRHQILSLKEECHKSQEFLISWTFALDLLERYFLVRSVDPIGREVIRYLFVEYDRCKTEETNVCLPNSLMFENFVFRMLSIGLTVPIHSPDMIHKILLLISEQYTASPTAVNLNAALARMLGQFLPSENHVDKLMNNLDLDSTASHMTPIDKLNQRSELDSEKELWFEYCNRQTALITICSTIPDSHLNHMFKAYKIEEFKFFQDLHQGSTINLKEINSPWLIEHLGLVLKGWSLNDLARRCVWSHPKETNQDKLKIFLVLVKQLPDGDLKCLALLCAANYFKIEFVRVFAHGVNPDRSQISYNLLLQFTQTIEELADGHHDKTIRQTCVEILRSIFHDAKQLGQRSQLQFNLMSALIKLLQDETHDIRQASTKVLSTLRDVFQLKEGELQQDKEQGQPIACSGYRTAYLIELICTRVLYPVSNLAEDLEILFELITKVIYNHTKTTEFDVNEERESLFDKTSPNIFADHVATIQETLDAAEKFYFRRLPFLGKHDVESIPLTQELRDELTAPVIPGRIDQTIGDYSWRVKNLGSISNTSQELAVFSNRDCIEQALVTVRDSLGYFNYQNMLTDTSFGYHELSVYKRLAFVTLIIHCTNYVPDNLCSEVRSELKTILTTSCATTILYKCYNLFTEVQENF